MVNKFVVAAYGVQNERLESDFGQPVVEEIDS